MTFWGICLITDDVARLTRFYGQVLQTEADGGDVHAELHTQGAGLAIYAKSDAEQTMGFRFDEHDGVGRMTLGFSVEDVDAVYERLVAMGLSIVTPPTTYSWGSRATHFRDPDGNIVGFSQQAPE
jgi:predicted enzyme related to lactoylglutathione lyase